MIIINIFMLLYIYLSKMKIETVFFPNCNLTIDYMVGLNAQDNFDIIDKGNPNDLWFHVTDLPSCHIIACISNEEKLSKKEIQTIIKRGAFICKKYSKYTHVPKLEITYTKLMNIQKSKPVGTVITTNTKTIEV